MNLTRNLNASAVGKTAGTMEVRNWTAQKDGSSNRMIHIEEQNLLSIDVTWHPEN